MAMPNLPTGSTPVQPTQSARGLAGRMAAPHVGGPDADVPMYAFPRSQFFYMHHPKCWTRSTTHGKGKRLTKPTLLPELMKFIISPGVFGCRTADKGEEPPDVYKNGVKKWRNDGFTFLDPNEAIPDFALPEGLPEGGYLRELKVAHPKLRAMVTRWTEAWDLPQPTLGDENQRFKYNHEHYELWRAWLVQSGRIAPAFEHIYDRWRDIHADRVARIAGLIINADVKAAMLEKRMPWLKHMDAIAPVQELVKVSRSIAA